MINQIAEKLTRFQLVMLAVWLLIATGLSVAAVSLSFWAERINQARLHAATADVLRTAFESNAQKRSRQTTINAIIAGGRRPGVSITIFDDTGRRIAGDQTDISPPLRAITFKNITPPKGALPAAPPPMVGFGGRPMLGPLPLGDVGTSLAWVRLSNGLALVRLTESTATTIERDYIIAMIILLALGIVAARPLQRRFTQHHLAPLASVESALRRLSEGEYSKIEVVGHEPGTAGSATIVEAYNAVADKLSSAIKRQVRTELNMRHFVAEAGHELRTPLTVLMGFIEVLQQGAIKDYALAQRILESAAVEGERMRALILKLLLLARLDTASSEHYELVDVSAIAREVVTAFQALPGGDRITLATEPRAFVTATSSEIRELMGNLLDNALKYAPGSVTRAAVRHVDGAVELSVADDGPGMTADLKGRAFDRFTRGDDRGSVPGSGLGLAIVKRIVDRARGTVELDSTPGKGTKVLVRMPAAQIEAE